MTITQDVIKLTNKNLYWTNILLIPSIIIIFLIVLDIYNWKDISFQDKSTYLYIWSGFFVYMILVFVLSSLYHYTYFIDSHILKSIAKLDVYTAPLLFIILLIINIIYVSFIRSNCNIRHISKNIDPLYIISSGFSILGSISWITKRILYKGYTKKGLIYKLKWIQTHSFFHYVTYTGVLLFLSLYYIENIQIYKYLFVNKEKC